MQLNCNDKGPVSQVDPRTKAVAKEIHSKCYPGLRSSSNMIGQLSEVV